MSKVIEIQSAVDFEKIISENNLVFVDFWAPWCGPCKQFGPIVDKVAEKFDNVKFVKVNIDKNQELAGLFNIRSIPTSIIFKNGTPFIGGPGVISEEQLTKIIDDVINDRIKPQ